MSKRTISIVLIVLGMVVLILSLAADLLGIGHYPGINGAQILGAAIGVVIEVAGIWLALSLVAKKK